MPKILLKPIWEFSKKHYKEIGMAMATAGKAGKKIKDNRNENKNQKGKVPFRKERFIQYKKEILQNLEFKKRKELVQYKLEVEQYIKQVKYEENQQIKVKKPLHSTRSKNWKDILIQIEDRIQIKDYHEYLLIYNDTNYSSSYFEGFVNLVDKFRDLMKEDKEELYKYLHNKTKQDISRIRSDFP